MEWNALCQQCQRGSYISKLIAFVFRREPRPIHSTEPASIGLCMSACSCVHQHMSPVRYICSLRNRVSVGCVVRTITPPLPIIYLLQCSLVQFLYRSASNVTRARDYRLPFCKMLSLTRSMTTRY